MRRHIAVLTLAAALGLGGCAHTFDTRTLGVPVTLASPAEQPAQGDRFEVTSRAVFGLWGILPLRHPSLRRTLAGQLVGGTAVKDVRIKVRSRWTDLLVTGLTLGLIVPRAVTYEGVVTRDSVPSSR